MDEPAPSFRDAAVAITEQTGCSVDEPLAAVLVARCEGTDNVTEQDVTDARKLGEPPAVASPRVDAYEAAIAAAKRVLRGEA